MIMFCTGNGFEPDAENLAWRLDWPLWEIRKGLGDIRKLGLVQEANNRLTLEGLAAATWAKTMPHRIRGRRPNLAHAA